jgi:hypothetical protein
MARSITTTTPVSTLIQILPFEGAVEEAWATGVRDAVQ